MTYSFRCVLALIHLLAIAAQGNAQAVFIESYNCHNYYYSQFYVTFTEARAIAQSFGPSAYLVAINDQAENIWVATHASSPSVWIGLTDELNEGVFIWDSGEPTGYTNWYPGQPDGANYADCVRMYSSSGYGNWADDPDYYSTIAVIEVPIEVPTIEILSVDAKEGMNETAHNAADYKAHYVLRRANTFEVKLEVSKDYSSECHEVPFEATHTFNGAPETIDIPAYDGNVPTTLWGAQVIAETQNGDQTKTLTVKITIPPNVAIGEYEFKAIVKQRAANDPDDEQAFDDPIVILFNPWGMSDQVYLANDSDRLEYILRQFGRIWKANYPSVWTTEWSYSQFDKDGVGLTVALHLMSGLNSTDRGNARLVARRFTGMVNSHNQNGGILRGKWEKPYTGGKDPESWTGSLAILKEYQMTGGPVKFGQCWVFAGLLNTINRVVGIPSRPISNFESGHDKNANKSIEQYWDASNRYIKNISEGPWNYHAWCDAWVDHQWNAVDATPQELSGGLFQLGPAPVPDVKANAGGDYDVDFVFTEVDGDLKVYDDDGTGTYVLRLTDTTAVGKQILTKKVGANGALDITAEYKAGAAPFGPDEDSFELLPSGIAGTLTTLPTVVLGQAIEWSLVLTNNDGVSHAVNVVASAAAVDYRGVLIAEIGLTADTTISLAPSQTEQFALSIPIATYVDWTGDTLVFETALFVEVVLGAPSDAWARVGATTLVPSPVSLTKTPSGPVTKGAGVLVSASYTNPLPIDLTNAEYQLLVENGLTIGGGSESTIPIGTVPSGNSANGSSSVDTLEVGIHALSVLLDSAELSGVKGVVTIAVLPTSVTAYCFGDGSATPCPCGNNGAPGEGCANSSGSGGVLLAEGSTSVAADDLAFAAMGLLPSQPVLLFSGMNAINGGNGIAFGDGLRCAGGSVVRLSVRYPDGHGTAQWGPGLAVQGGWNPGDQRRFQAWYRDPVGSPCGANFNLTTALESSFTP